MKSIIQTDPAYETHREKIREVLTRFDFSPWTRCERTLLMAEEIVALNERLYHIAQSANFWKAAHRSDVFHEQTRIIELRRELQETLQHYEATVKRLLSLVTYRVGADGLMYPSTDGGGWIHRDDIISALGRSAP